MKSHLDMLHGWMEGQDAESLVAMSTAQRVEGFNTDHVKELGKKMLATPGGGKYTTLEVAVAFQVALSFLCMRLLAEETELFELIQSKGGKEDA